MRRKDISALHPGRTSEEQYTGDFYCFESAKAGVSLPWLSWGICNDVSRDSGEADRMLTLVQYFHLEYAQTEPRQ